MRTFIIITITTIVSIVALLYAAQTLISHIYRRTDCERFNIDNIEVRTGINIPAIVDYDCHAIGKTKQSQFVLDTSKVDIREYAYTNKFNKVNDLYINQGRRKDTEWLITLDPKSAELCATIVYR